MKKHYYLIGSALGLLAALLMLAAIMGRYALQLLSISDKYNGIIPVFVGAITALALGFFFDKKGVPEKFINQFFLIPTFIFICGAITGCLANYFLNGYPDYFYDYFNRPIWALGLFGYPACLVVSLAWQFGSRHLEK